MRLEKALESLKKGRFLVLFDGSEREGESDLVIHASHCTPGAIEFMRRNAGGLICLATDTKTANALSLPYFHELLASTPLACLTPAKMPYGDKPSFSILFSHRDTYTGVTDNDRSKTMREFAGLLESNNGTRYSSRKGTGAPAFIRSRFLKSFRSPGHVHLLIGRSLSERRGHTELSLRLCELARLSPAVVLCEMLGKGKALSRKKAKEFAKKNGFEFIEGKELVE